MTKVVSPQTTISWYSNQDTENYYINIRDKNDKVTIVHTKKRNCFMDYVQ